jgi:hypothetical protein
MSELNQKIEKFLASEKMSFSEGLMLYVGHPEHKKGVAKAIEHNYRHKSAHEKLVYELERCIGAKNYTNRATVITESLTVIPQKMIAATEKVAPSNFDYALKAEDMSDYQKAMVIEKGQLYNQLQIKKKELASFGSDNSERAVEKRQEIRAQMVAITDRIKSIHGLLQEKELLVPEAENSEEISPKSMLSIPDELAGFNLEKISDAEKKLLLKQTQSNVAKQLERAESSKKEETREENARAAERGQMLIDWLKRYFEQI